MGRGSIGMVSRRMRTRLSLKWSGTSNTPMDLFAQPVCSSPACSLSTARKSQHLQIIVPHLHALKPPQHHTTNQHDPPRRTSQRHNHQIRHITLRQYHVHGPQDREDQRWYGYGEDQEGQHLVEEVRCYAVVAVEVDVPWFGVDDVVCALCWWHVLEIG